jgi:tellurite resistance protein TehA-like permease
MNVKLFFRVTFFITGTLIILFLGIIVAINFFKDARILHTVKA